MAPKIAESGHWYKKDGTPFYTIKAKNGEIRNTTLRDARALDLVPSVTTIIACAAKPALENWKQDQTILACLTLPRKASETEEEYIVRLKADSKAQAVKAAQRGTKVHAWIQEGFEGNPVTPEGLPFFESALKEIVKHTGRQDWTVELPFANDLYGGKVDLQNNETIIDIKTTEKNLETIKTWDDHDMQLAAYRQDTKRKCAILYINVLDATSKLLWIEEENLERGIKCFMSLVYFWYAKNKMKIPE